MLMLSEFARGMCSVASKRCRPAEAAEVCLMSVISEVYVRAQLHEHRRVRLRCGA